MPVRSSICTYSPSTSSNSKYSSVLPAASSLSIGNYKPISGGSALKGTKSYSYGKSSGSSLINSFNSNVESPSRYSLSSSSSYSPTSLSSSSSPSSSSNYSSKLGHYRPLDSSSSIYSNNRLGSSNLSSSGPSYSRYNSASSTSSLNSTGSSLLDRNDFTSGYYSSSSNYSYQPSSLTRRLSTTSQTDPLPAGVPRGLVNLGNTCYMNAVIQSLYSIESFRNFILRAPSSKTLASELCNLFKNMKESSSTVNPSSFKSTFSNRQCKFLGYGQQDAQEFLRYLINDVHEEYNQASKRPRRTSPPRAPQTAGEAWSQYRTIVDDSPLVDIVVGQMCSTIICSICRNKSSCWDPFWDLSLPLTRGKYSSISLSDVVQDFIAIETLDSDERPICSSCKRATKSSKQIELCRLPQLMILHLKKFTNDGYKMTYPEVEIDNVLRFNDGTTYTLTACISHHGRSSSSGHYTSHCKYSSKWFHFNDDRVKEVTSNFDSSKLTEAYVLFYTQATSQSRL